MRHFLVASLLLVSACASMPTSYPNPDKVTAQLTMASPETIKHMCRNSGEAACTLCAPGVIPCHVYMPSEGYGFQQLGCIFDHEFRYHVMAYMRGEATWASHPTTESQYCYPEQTKPAVGQAAN